MPVNPCPFGDGANATVGMMTGPSPRVAAISDAMLKNTMPALQMSPLNSVVNEPMTSPAVWYLESLFHPAFSSPYAHSFAMGTEEIIETAP